MDVDGRKSFKLFQESVIGIVTGLFTVVKLLALYGGSCLKAVSRRWSEAERKGLEPKHENNSAALEMDIK